MEMESNAVVTYSLQRFCFVDRVQGSNENDNDTSKCSLTNTQIVVNANPLKEGG